MIKISPTQISMFKLCPRKWAFRYIDKVKSEPSPAMEFGKEGHRVLEEYLFSGTQLPNNDIGQLIRKAVKKDLLPLKIGDMIEIEKEILSPISTYDAFYYGFIDILWLDKNMIIDHKFTKSFRYMKTEEELRKDPQSLIYSYAFMKETNSNTCVNRWIYYAASGNSRPRKIIGVKAIEFTRDMKEVEKGLEKLSPIIEKIILLHNSKDISANDVVHDSCACKAFGGCEYRSLCDAPTSSLVAEVAQYDLTNRRNEKMANSLLEKLRKENGKKVIEKKEATKVVEEKEATKIIEEKEVTKEAIEKEATKVVEEKPKKERKKRTKKEPVINPEKEDPLIVMFNAGIIKGNEQVNNLVFLIELLDHLMIQIAEENKVAHWSLVEYGQGKVLLAHAFDKWLDESQWKGTIVVSNSAESQAVKEVLINHADIIIHGIS